MGLPDAEKQAYWGGRYPDLRAIYERAIGRGEIAPETDIDLCLDVNNAVFYFSLWAKGEPLTLARRYQVIELIVASVRAPRAHGARVK